MIELSIAPLSVAAAVSRVVTMNVRNPDSRALTNIVVSLDVPSALGLEQGRARLHLDRLDGGAAYDHVLRVRPPHPGRFTIDVPNLSFRDGYGRAHRERSRSLDLDVEPADETSTLLSAGNLPAAHATRASIFVSYRRSDTYQSVVPLVRELGQHKNLSRVDMFVDIRDIPAGTEWSNVLDEELRACDLLVAIIGPNWAEQRTDSGSTRLQDPNDVVRREVATALKRRIPILPVLVNAAMPTTTELPGEISSLARWQAFKLDLDLVGYGSSVKQLGKRIGEILH
jgi:hypothetical protein